MTFEHYVTKAEIAQHLRVTMRTVDNLMARRVIPYVRVGRLIRFKITQVDRALEEKYRLNAAWK